jgi:predicted transcriptional regulator
MSETQNVLINLVAEIVSAYVSNNNVPATDIPTLIATTHDAIAGLGKITNNALKVDKPIPAISPKKSITPDYLVCLEDGRKFKSLKRHLRTAFGMTPDQYRAKWGLQNDYPMVAPAYAEARSQLAKRMGLGQQRRKTVVKARGKAA